MIHRKIAHHFLPHYLVDSQSAHNLSEPHRVHHRAHALSLVSLFIYLQVLVITGVGLFVIQTRAPQILGTISFSADQIITLTNQKRAENGLSGLTFNSQLAVAAAAKAQSMFSENYWAHNSPSGKTPWSFITAAGYRYVFAGENLARDFDDAGSVVDAWMNSSSHRSNLLDRNFKEIGVSVVDGKLTGREGILVVQMFGASVSQIPVAQTVAAASPLPSASTSPTPEATPAASPFSSPPPDIAQVQSELNSQATVLSSRQFSIAKIVSFSVIGFIFGLFVLEVLVTLRRERVQLRSGVIAHLLLLAFVLFVVWYAISGAIL